MNSVGIDISKGRSTVAVMRPFGEVVISPFEVRHTDSELSELARQLKSLNGETRVVMEATGNYHAPVAKLLHDAGLYVSVVNAKLVHVYGNNDLRRVKTDRKDAVKLANYGLDRWLTLPRYVPEEDTRLLLKNCYRQYRQYSKVQTVLKNNLISLLDTVFPNVNRLFSSPIRGDGSEKWVDFVMANRTKKDFDHPYDIVGGPVANDRVYAAFALYESGLLNKEELIRELKTHVLSDQWLFHTVRSLHYISFKEAKEVHL